MLRLAVLLLASYALYRVGKEFIDSVPDDFDPVMSGSPAGRPGRAVKRNAAPRAAAVR